MNREEQNMTNYTDLRNDMLSVAQALGNLTRDVRDLRNNRVAWNKTIHRSPPKQIRITPLTCTKR